jgi:uncharacterized protein YbjT (DUF2867 family)
VGCGDVGLRVARLLAPRVRVLALTSSPARVPALRAQGITPLAGNLDAPASLRRLAGLATRAAPGAAARSRAWGSAHPRAAAGAAPAQPARRAGVWLHQRRVWRLRRRLGDETAALKASTPRAQRRVDAEALVRWAGPSGVRASILRIPGIYAPDREGGTPRARLLKGTPVLAAPDDVYTNHIHADDLARACVAALWRGRPQRVYNVNDDSQLQDGRLL